MAIPTNNPVYPISYHNFTPGEEVIPTQRVTNQTTEERTHVIANPLYNGGSYDPTTLFKQGFSDPITNFSSTIVEEPLIVANAVQVEDNSISNTDFPDPVALLEEIPSHEPGENQYGGKTRKNSKVSDERRQKNLLVARAYRKKKKEELQSLENDIERLQKANMDLEREIALVCKSSETINQDYDFQKQREKELSTKWEFLLELYENT